MTTDPQPLLRQLAVDDQVATVVVAALFADDPAELLDQAAALAQTTRERQLVAIAAAHVRGERDLVGALAREHLIDHPESVVVAWIAGAARDGDIEDRPS